MVHFLSSIYDIITDELSQYMDSLSIESSEWRSKLVFERPPKIEMGDVAVPLFPFAKVLRKSPAVIAQELAERWQNYDLLDTVDAVGPYLNCHLKRKRFSAEILHAVQDKGSNYGQNQLLQGQRILIEYSSPNTNKPLHLGHLRNDVIGESLRRILIACSAEVQSVNLINDRGVHICKAMLAYQKFAEGKTPETEQMKPDHFVGQYYVRFENWVKQDDGALAQAQEMLQHWEAGNEEVRSLWQQMRDWVMNGIKESYARCQIHFDSYDFESETYTEGRDAIYKGLEQDIFFRKDDASIWIDLSDIGLDQKTLLRSDGTSLYVTQDIGTVLQRYRRFPFDRHIYVVANEQIYHFQVLFHIMKRMGYEWADQLYHRSYGMVYLPEGKMKSREGVVVDADNLLDQLCEMAGEQIQTKRQKESNDAENNRESNQQESPEEKKTAESIALAALHYYLLSPNPGTDINFNPEQSLAFTGNTGPYLQYTLTRISSMQRKAEEMAIQPSFDAEGLDSNSEWELLRCIADYPQAVESAAEQYDSSIVAQALFTAAQIFSRYYHEQAIVTEKDKKIAAARLGLVMSVGQIIRHGLYLLVIPSIEKM